MERLVAVPVARVSGRASAEQSDDGGGAVSQCRAKQGRMARGVRGVGGVDRHPSVQALLDHANKPLLGSMPQPPLKLAFDACH